MASKSTQRQRELELHQAVGSGDVEGVSRLLSQGVDPNCIGESSRNFKYAFTALCATIHAVAQTYSQPKIDATLREAMPGSRVIETDYATLRTNLVEIVRQLLAAGADPNHRSYSRTPLSLAAWVGDTEVVKILLDAGASAAGECWSPYSRLPRPKSGLAFCNNAIHEAALNGHTDVVRLLCESGADVSACDHEGKTALLIAHENGHADIVRVLEQYKETHVAG